MKKGNKATSNNTINLLLMCLLILSAFSGAYYTLRYSRRNMEVDASRQARAADAIHHTGTLINPEAYPNGMAFSGIMAAVSLISGLEVQNLQVASGTLAFIFFFAAFICFKQMLGSAVGGLSAAFLLLVQPDFLFYILRGSHERLTWMFALIILFLVLRGRAMLDSPWHFLNLMILFYLAYWGMVISNAYFASAFLLAISSSLLINWIIDHFSHLGNQRDEKWQVCFFLIALSCFILLYLFITIAYQPAQSVIQIFGNLYDKLGLLFLNFDIAQDPYAKHILSTAWRSRGIYRLVTAAQWFLSLAGLITWLWSSFHLGKLSPEERLLWGMYASFGMMLALGILADFAGFLSQNLQLRIFTPFSIFSTGMLVGHLRRIRPLSKITHRRALLPPLGLTTALVLIGSLLKITNDPLISNTWTFYTPAEVHGFQWMEDNMQGQKIWVDSSEHLQEVFLFEAGADKGKQNTYFYTENTKDMAAFLFSQRVQMESAQRGLMGPPMEGKLRIYDNGTVQVYRKRPLTPYQR
jgi:hypothetical protein